MTSPSFLSPDALIADLKWRYAVKEFDPGRRIPDEHWAALERALALSPSSYGLQPWTFMVIRDVPTRHRLFLASMGQRKVIDSSHLVVFAARTSITEIDVSRWMARLAELRNTPAPDLIKMHSLISNDLVTGPRHAASAEWAKRQVYLALGVFLTSAAITGIDTCPMEGFDPTAYDDILGLAERGYTTTVVATAGYRSPTDASAAEIKARYAAADVVVTV